MGRYRSSSDLVVLTIGHTIHGCLLIEHEKLQNPQKCKYFIYDINIAFVFYSY